MIQPCRMLPRVLCLTGKVVQCQTMRLSVPVQLTDEGKPGTRQAKPLHSLFYSQAGRAFPSWTAVVASFTRHTVFCPCAYKKRAPLPPSLSSLLSLLISSLSLSTHIQSVVLRLTPRLYKTSTLLALRRSRFCSRPQISQRPFDMAFHVTFKMLSVFMLIIISTINLTSGMSQ